MAVRSKPRLPSRLEKKPRRTISTEPHPMFETARLFLFSAYAGQSPRAGDPACSSIFRIRICVISPLFSILTKKTGVPLLSQAGPYRFVPTPAAHCTIVLSGARLSLGQAQLWKHLHCFRCLTKGADKARRTVPDTRVSGFVRTNRELEERLARKAPRVRLGQRPLLGA